MEEKIFKQIKVLLILTFISLVLVAFILLYDVVFVNHLPDYLVRPAATSDLEVRIQNVESGLQTLQRDLVSQLNRKLYYFGGIALLIAGIASIFGIKTFRDIDGLIKEKIKATLEKQLYQLDITNQKIWVISNKQTEEDMREITQRLKLSGFTYYEELEKMGKSSFAGITILPVFDEPMEKEFSEFLRRNKSNLRAREAAFILYTKSYQVKSISSETFANMTFANFPLTVVSHLLTVGRGLIVPGSKKEDQ